MKEETYLFIDDLSFEEPDNKHCIADGHDGSSVTSFDELNKERQSEGELGDDSKIFVCSICLRPCATNRGLKCHQLRKHSLPSGTKRLATLPKRMTNSWKFSDISSRCEAKISKPYQSQCNLCGLMCPSAQALYEKHKVVEHGIQLPTCEVCSRRFVRAYALLQHQQKSKQCFSAFVLLHPDQKQAHDLSLNITGQNTKRE